MLSIYLDYWPSQGKIEYKNYSVVYREGLKPVLQNLNIIIEPQDKIEVVGRTGAGKSTLTLILLRILEALEGNIIIDDIDISTISLKQLREHITMILQDLLYLMKLQEKTLTLQTKKQMKRLSKLRIMLFKRVKKLKKWLEYSVKVIIQVVDKNNQYSLQELFQRRAKLFQQMRPLRIYNQKLNIKFKILYNKHLKIVQQQQQHLGLIQFYIAIKLLLSIQEK